MAQIEAKLGRIRKEVEDSKAWAQQQVRNPSQRILVSKGCITLNCMKRAVPEEQHLKGYACSNPDEHYWLHTPAMSKAATKTDSI